MIILLIYQSLFASQIQAQYTSIPDTNFEQELINQGIDSDNTINGRVLTSDIDTLTVLNVFNPNIYSLDGIEGFTALKILNISNHNITSLNLNSNINLERLSCDACTSLGNLQIDSLENLRYLSCEECSVLNLNLNNKPNLTELNISYCYMSTIDLSECPNLDTFICRYNTLSQLDISVNTALKNLYCGNNQIETLNLDNNILLENIYCNNNHLDSLSVRNGNNQIITGFYARNNPLLTCIYVDDRYYSTQNWTYIDNQSVFVENNTQCNNLSIYDVEYSDIIAYPNPASNYITINYPDIRLINIYDVSGKIILSTQNLHIDISGFEPGVYFVEILANNLFKFRKKIIKK